MMAMSAMSSFDFVSFDTFIAKVEAETGAAKGGGDSGPRISREEATQ